MGVERLNLYCDICGQIADETFFDYLDIVGYKKANGWTSKKEFGVWFDTCPECNKLIDN